MSNEDPTITIRLPSSISKILSGLLDREDSMRLAARVVSQLLDQAALCGDMNSTLTIDPFKPPAVPDHKHADQNDFEDYATHFFEALAQATHKD